MKAFKEFGIQILKICVQYDDAVSNTDTPRDSDVSVNTVEFLGLDKQPSGKISCHANFLVLPTHLQCNNHTLSQWQPATTKN